MFFFKKKNPKSDTETADYFVSLIKNSSFWKEYFFNKLRKELVECAIEYPSVINNGYLHIERAFNLIDFLELSHINSIIDVGSAKGEIAIQFTERFPLASVYCFEPIHSTFLDLEKKVKGFPKISIYNKGLGSEDKEMEMQIAERITSSSFFPISSSIQNPFFSSNLKKATSEKISITSLDRMIDHNEKINLLKIDVQGYEVEVLKGAKRILKNTAVIIVEMQNHKMYKGAPLYFELDAYLRSQEFSLFDIIPSIRQQNKLYEWDSIYVANSIALKFDT